MLNIVSETKTPGTIKATNDYLRHHGICKGDTLRGYEVITTYEGELNEWGIRESNWTNLTWDIEVNGKTVNVPGEDFTLLP